MRTLLGSSARPSRTAILSGTDSAEQADGPAVVVDLAEDVVRDVGAARPGPPHHLQPQGQPAVEAVEVALEVEIGAPSDLSVSGAETSPQAASPRPMASFSRPSFWRAISVSLANASFVLSPGFCPRFHVPRPWPDRMTPRS